MSRLLVFAYTYLCHDLAKSTTQYKISGECRLVCGSRLYVSTQSEIFEIYVGRWATLISIDFVPRKQAHSVFAQSKLIAVGLPSKQEYLQYISTKTPSVKKTSRSICVDQVAPEPPPVLSLIRFVS
jgi:hypothetical protein